MLKFMTAVFLSLSLLGWVVLILHEVGNYANVILNITTSWTYNLASLPTSAPMLMASTCGMLAILCAMIDRVLPA